MTYLVGVASVESFEHKQSRSSLRVSQAVIPCLGQHSRVASSDAPVAAGSGDGCILYEHSRLRLTFTDVFPWIPSAHSWELIPRMSWRIYLGLSGTLENYLLRR